MYTNDKKLAITTEPKIICFDLPKDAYKNLKPEIDSIGIIKHNRILAKHTTKNKINWLLAKYGHGNSKTNEQHSLFLVCHKD